MMIRIFLILPSLEVGFSVRLPEVIQPVLLHGHLQPPNCTLKGLLQLGAKSKRNYDVEITFKNKGENQNRY